MIKRTQVVTFRSDIHLFVHENQEGRINFCFELKQIITYSVPTLSKNRNTNQCKNRLVNFRMSCVRHIVRKNHCTCSLYLI